MGAEVLRFECKNEKSNKFWQVTDLKNGYWRAEWGRIGRPPQGTKDYFEGEMRKLIAEKLGKGYVRVEGDYNKVVNQQMEAIERMKAKRSEPAKVVNFLEELRKIK